jgi:putative ABC transport system ATP-binding protein
MDDVTTGLSTFIPTSTAATATTLLKSCNVTKTYRTGAVEVHALRGIDLEIQTGEMMMIMGPSGHGKTTLLNCLSGLDDIDGGTVMIGEHDVHASSDRARTRFRAEQMGFIFQSFNLIGVLSAVENVEIPLLVTGHSAREARSIAGDMMARVGLDDRLRNRPNELSGGEQQRVAIARALVSRPAIVWADEPTGNLDSATAESILDLLGEVHDQGQTLVIVTHDKAIADGGTRIVHIEDGLVATDESVNK